jgi:hypothetical protein
MDSYSKITHAQRLLKMDEAQRETFRKQIQGGTAILKRLVSDEEIFPARKHHKSTARTLKMHQRNAQELLGLSHKTDEQLRKIIRAEKAHMEQQRASGYAEALRRSQPPEPEPEGRLREFTEDPELLSLVSRPTASRDR